MKESDGSAGLDDREKMLLAEMRENVEKHLAARRRLRTRPLDDRKARYPTGVYGFDEAIDGSLGDS